MTVCAAAAALLACGCSHILAQVDVDSLRDSQVQQASAYNDLDAGMTKTKVKIAYCSDHAVLARSGQAEDAGIACPQ